jgi:hypothetical protein
MSRWIQEFQQGPFKTNWQDLLNTVEKLEVDDETVAPTVEELARLRKALAFIDGIIGSLDLELTPRSVWAAAQGQLEACVLQVRQYLSNRNQGHLIQANEHADNLLAYFRPYMVAPVEAVEAHGIAVRTFAEQVSGYAASLQSKGVQSLEVLAVAAAKGQKHLESIEAMEKRAKSFDEYLFEGVDGNESAENLIKEAVKTAQTDCESINELRTEITAKQKTTLSKAETTDAEIDRQVEEFTKLLDSITLKHSDLARFYQKIFGKKLTDDDNETEGGLEQELDARLAQLNKYESDQQTRHATLFDRIESLLPGATSAGLATAYQTLTKQFEAPVKQYTRAFNLALGALLLCGLAVVVDTVSLYPLHVEFVKGRDWDELIRTLLTRLPILLPVVWFAIFSATRRSQYERLQQEYAHKHALASSYESYKKQLQDLKVDADVLQRELIAKTIDAVAFNASKTLDGNHAEKPPALQLIERLSVEDAKKLWELVKSGKS